MKHTCHWPTCEKEVPPKMWGCKSHWFTLPQRLRSSIWATYVPGQEITKTPSEAYLQVASVVQLWAFNHIWENGTDKERESIRDQFLSMCKLIAGDNFEWPEGLRPNTLEQD